MGIAGVTIAAVAIAVLLMLGKLPPWPVVAKDDGPEMGWFDRFVGQPGRENFPSAAQFPGIKIAARSVNEEALLVEGLRRKHSDQADKSGTAHARPRGNCGPC
jgi:hypothetical protein